MYAGRTIFTQVMDTLPPRRFHTCVRRYGGNHKVQRFTCLDQFRVMAFAQLTYRQPLRDIEVCLRAMQPKLYHRGIRCTVSRNTLAHANEVRDWRIYADSAQPLIGRARRPTRWRCKSGSPSRPICWSPSSKRNGASSRASTQSYRS